jgi:lipopolysaccharide transport system permease protein
MSAVTEAKLASGLADARTQPLIVIRPSRGLFDLNLHAVWQYRQLLWFFVWRDVKVRYKQTAFGAGWAVIQPLVTMVIFTVVFGGLAGIPSDGIPYAPFAYAGLLPWNFFSSALTRCTWSVVGDASLVSKTYFPRLLMPFAAPLSAFVELAISFVMLLVLMAWYGIRPSWAIVTLPAFLLLAMASALAPGLLLAAINVRYHDIGYTVPFLVQMWMYASPVVYPVSLIPPRWRFVYSLNPMTGVIEGFRWALLGKAGPDFRTMAVSAVVVLALLVVSLVVFRRMESTFADFI